MQQSDDEAVPIFGGGDILNSHSTEETLENNGCL